MIAFSASDGIDDKVSVNPPTHGFYSVGDDTTN